jgi:hypothetical protein
MYRDIQSMTELCCVSSEGTVTSLAIFGVIVLIRVNMEQLMVMGMAQTHQLSLQEFLFH